MKTEEIKSMAAAYLEVLEAKKAKAPVTDKADDGEGMDPVDKVAVKKDFDDRKDKDLDNDGDTDSSDEYLHKKRKAISKKVDKADDKVEVEVDEAMMGTKRNIISKAASSHSKAHVVKGMSIAKKMSGNMTGATKAIDKVNPGLSGHPQVKSALRTHNEEVSVEEAKDDVKCWDGHSRVPGTKAGEKGSCKKDEDTANENKMLRNKALAKAAQSSKAGKAAVSLKKAPFSIPKKKLGEESEGLQKWSVYRRILEKATADKDGKHLDKATKPQEIDDTESKDAEDFKDAHLKDAPGKEAEKADITTAIAKNKSAMDKPMKAAPMNGGAAKAKGDDKADKPEGSLIGTQVKEGVEEGFVGNLVNKMKAPRITKHLNTAIAHHNSREADHKSAAKWKAQMPHGGSASSKAHIQTKVDHRNSEAAHHATAAGHLNNALKAHKAGDAKGVRSAMKSYHMHNTRSSDQSANHHDLPHTFAKASGGKFNPEH